jgi:hypothetical protein
MVSNINKQLRWSAISTNNCDGQQYQQNEYLPHISSNSTQKRTHHLVLEIEVLAWTGTKM